METSARAWILFGSFNLMDARFNQPMTATGWPNGLVAVEAPGRICIVTATRDAEVVITLEALEEAPGDADSKWEAGAEVSMTTSGALEIFTGDALDQPIGLTGLPAGSVRVRVHALNRVPPTYTAAGEAVRPTEEFLLQVWPAPERPESVLRTDSFGRDFQSASRHTQPMSTSRLSWPGASPRGRRTPCAWRTGSCRRSRSHRAKRTARTGRR